MLNVKVIGGTVYKLIEVHDDCICNEDYFKSAMKQLIEDYVTILDKDEIVDFTCDVINQVKFAKKEITTIDIDEELWKQIKEAATESSWMPPDYMMNDWVADICQFLKHGGKQCTE